MIWAGSSGVHIGIAQATWELLIPWRRSRVVGHGRPRSLPLGTVWQVQGEASRLDDRIAGQMAIDMKLVRVSDIVSEEKKMTAKAHFASEKRK